MEGCFFVVMTDVLFSIVWFANYWSTRAGLMCVGKVDILQVIIPPPLQIEDWKRSGRCDYRCFVLETQQNNG